MAIYHCSIKTVSRSSGRSSTAAAAYRAGVCLEDERTGKIHDYTRKQGVEHAEFVLPEGVNLEREQLWNAAEAAENRKNSTVAREYELALPEELTPDQRKELIREFALHLAGRYGVAADITIHGPGKDGDHRNHHAHILTTTRQVTPEGFGAKTRALDEKKSGEVEHIRTTWAELTNRALVRAGHKVQVNHQSLKAQGIKRMPTAHMGPTATAMERRGIQTKRGDLNRDAAQVNDQIEFLEKARRELEVVSVAQDSSSTVFEPVRHTGPQILDGKAAKAKQWAEFEREQAESAARLEAAKRKRQEVEFWGKELLGQMENANSASEYKTALLGIARIAEGPKVERVYTEWIKPYMTVIDDAGPNHREAFQQCVQLAKQDATMDKELLQKMKRDFRDALRGTGGTGSKRDRDIKEMMDVIRLHGDRQKGFERVSNTMLKKLQRGKNMGIGF